MPEKKKLRDKPKPLESSFKKRVNNTLDAVPGLFHITIQAGSIAGIPDKIICYKGRFIAWELKRSEADCLKARDGHVLQRYIIKKINDCGGIGRFVYPENFQEMLEEILCLE